MAYQASWRAQRSAIDRYEMIQKIQTSLNISTAEATALEQAAFQDSPSEQDYVTACSSASHQETNQDVIGISDIDSEPGIRIGPYPLCQPIASGLTSEVYRAGDVALKVITSHNMPPHNPHREAKILRLLRRPCVPLLDVFRDQHQQLVLAFPYMPLTLATLFEQSPRGISTEQIRAIFSEVLSALADIHAQGIIHRDIKPEAILLASPQGPALLSDFGTAWHPEMSLAQEAADDKILDVGTGPYRSPEALFGDKSYGPALDMWGLGVALAEALVSPPNPIFESRSAHEDGSQLGLILSIFKTLGTPTKETWPEAEAFKVSPFELWTIFPSRPWVEILPDVEPVWRNLVSALLRYDGNRLTAEQALKHECLQADAA